VGRVGSCFNNALAESFNATLKVERVNRTAYPTREHARKDVARYIEFRYNTKRLHSALGYRTPREAYSTRISGKRPDNTNSSYPKNAGRPTPPGTKNPTYRPEATPFCQARGFRPAGARVGATPGKGTGGWGTACGS
jgi:hypothetical protein